EAPSLRVSKPIPPNPEALPPISQGDAVPRSPRGPASPATLAPNREVRCRRVHGVNRHDSEGDAGLADFGTRRWRHAYASIGPAGAAPTVPHVSSANWPS